MHDNIEPKGVNMRAPQICGREFRGRAQQPQKQRPSNTHNDKAQPCRWGFPRASNPPNSRHGTRTAKARLPYVIPKHRHQDCLSAAEIQSNSRGHRRSFVVLWLVSINQGEEGSMAHRFVFKTSPRRPCCKSELDSLQ